VGTPAGWGTEARRKRKARAACASRRDVHPIVVPWLSEAPTGLDALRQLGAGLDLLPT